MSRASCGDDRHKVVGIERDARDEHFELILVQGAASARAGSGADQRRLQLTLNAPRSRCQALRAVWVLRRRSSAHMYRRRSPSGHPIVRDAKIELEQALPKSPQLGRNCHQSPRS
ncbi:hypothetical protein LPU83_pLPU83d_0626 (plasmid) [Rhizobium favelukesii]|uniref:Uncharacterized protein n=1 Tax=Rhizobium favelukesii TaxID=348824 RepID=W6RLL9_9HYPH|nr:hypothetical protein LPU83_pLPU83d_0626 [Rhizobium favelukesii]